MNRKSNILNIKKISNRAKITLPKIQKTIQFEY